MPDPGSGYVDVFFTEPSVTLLRGGRLTLATQFLKLASDQFGQGVLRRARAFHLC